MYVWLVPFLAGLIFLVMITAWFLPFFNTVRFNAEKYQSLLAEKIAGDISLFFHYSNRVVGNSNRLFNYLSSIKMEDEEFFYILDRFGRPVFYSSNFFTIQEKSLGASAPVRGLGWWVVVGVPLSIALQEQRTALSVALLFFLIGLLFLILLTIVIKKLIRGDHRRPFKLLLHKVRTPLTSIKWNLHSLLAGDWGAIGDQQRRFLERSYDANQQMIKLADELADSAVLEVGNYRFEFVKNDIFSLVGEIVEELALEAKQANIKIILEKPQEGCLAIAMDRPKLKLALKHLLDNAIRYNLSGGRVEIKISKDRGTLVIKFIDTGIGIAEDQRARLFSKFFRTIEATRMQSSGFGLGLYIAKLIINGHGGKIMVESEEHKGATFSIILPL